MFSQIPNLAFRRRKSLCLERLEPRIVFAGDLDVSFGGDGIVSTPVNGNASGGIQLDGDRIVLAGTAAGDFAVVRFTADGALDSTFGAAGKATVGFGVNAADEANDLAITPSGKYVVVGQTLAPHVVTTVSGKKTTTSTVTSHDFAVARFNANGTLDSSFSGDGRATFEFGDAANAERAKAVVVQPDGKIIVGGEFVVSGSDWAFALTRFNVDGTVDTSFGIGGKTVTNVVPGSEQLLDLALQTVNGTTYIIAGGRALNGASYDFTVVRYTTNGILDTSFGPGGIVFTDLRGSDSLNALVIQPDGKIVGAGAADASSSAASRNDMALVRYEVNGALDSSFGAGGKSIVIRQEHQLITGITQQPDGKLVVAGTVLVDLAVGTDYRCSLAARFDAQGSLDLTFADGGISLWDVNTAQNSPNDELVGGIALRPDGKLLVAGTHSGSQWTVTRLLGDDVDKAIVSANSLVVEDDKLLSLLAADSLETDQLRRRK
jgi:uncharacterized delta-60 repeat protein